MPKQIKQRLAKHILADGLDVVFDFEKSSGAYLYDQVTERKYIDFFSFFSSQALGYNHPKMQDEKYLEQLIHAARIKITNSDIYSKPYADFVSTFAQKVGRDFFQYHFFISGGSLAVENTLKTAFDWKVRLNLKNNRGEKGYDIIHFKNAFHGRSGYTLSLTNTYDPRKYMYFARFDWPRLSSPQSIFPLEGENLQNVIKQEADALGELENLIKQKKDDLAALILEPIQAEGGDNHFRKEFLQELRRITSENEILLIFDEVQTGGGATGKWFAFEHFDVIPDGIAWSKKFQTGGCSFTTRIDNVENNVFHESSRINSTFGGNIVDMVRCQRIIEIVEEENLLENVQKVGEYFLGKLHALADVHSTKISNVRGRGFMLAFDVPTATSRDNALEIMRSNGLMALPCGEKSIRFRPMLDTSPQVVDEAATIIDKSIDSMK